MASYRRSIKGPVAALVVALIWTMGFVPPDAQAAGTGPVTYTYDANGRLSGVIDSSGSAAYAYDATGNVSSITRRPLTTVAILEFTPDRASSGSEVTIEGTGFSATASQNTVRFNGTAATISSASTTKLVVAVPAAATTGTIAVTAPGGATTTSASFTVANPAPTITTIPTVLDRGAAFTVTGTNFDSVISRDVLAVNGVRATITTASSTSLTATLPVTGSGRVQVVTENGTAVSGGYVFVWPSASSTPVDTTGVITIGTPTLVPLVPSKVALRVFDGTVGQHLIITTTGGSVGSYTVYRPDGTYLNGASIVSNGVLDLFALPATGTYTIAAQSQGTTMTPTFSVTSAVADIVLPITLGGATLVATNNAPGQDVRLTFQGTAGQRVIVRGFNGTVQNTSTSLLGPGDMFLVRSVIAFPTKPFLDPTNLPVTGTYTILVHFPFSNVGSLSVEAYLDPGDVTSSVAMGQRFIFPTLVAGQNIAVTFSGTAGQRVSVDALNNGSFSATISIRKPDGTDLDSTMQWGWFFEPFILPTTGIYTVYVDPWQGQTGPGSIAVFDVPPDSAGTIAIDGAIVTVQLVPGQNGSLTFDGTAGTTVSLTTFNGDSVYVRILDPAGNQVGAAAAQQPFVEPVVLPTTGTYTITVDQSGAGQGSYDLRLYSVPPEDTGTMTMGDPTVTVANTAPGQNMSRTFSGTAGQKIAFNLDVLSVTYSRYGMFTVGIKNPGGSYLWAPHMVYVTSTGKYLDVTTLPASGTYTIEIDPYLEGVLSLGLSLYAVPPDETGTITVGGPSVIATNTVPGQNMTRTFTCTSGQKVKVVASSSTIAWTALLILNPNGTWVGEALFQPPGGTATATIAAAGTCTISINPMDNATGSVTLALTNNPSGAAAAKPAPKPTTETVPAGDASALLDSTGDIVDAERIAPKSTCGPVGQLDQSLPASNAPASELWNPGSVGDWRTHRATSAAATAPIPSAKSGITGLAGRVLTIDGRPLANVTMRFNDCTGFTDDQGRFLLSGIKPGPGVLLIDGTTADRKNREYGTYEVALVAVQGETTKLPYTIWMTALDSENTVKIPVETTSETVVTTPAIPGLELHIPAGSSITDESGEPVTELGLTAIPLDRPPFPLPANAEVPIYFTIQPGLAYVAPRGAWIVYPNYNHLSPGTRTSFWQYDPDGKDWFIYGHGAVTADGTQVVPDKGVRIYEFTGAMFTTGEQAPGTGPAPDGDSADGDPVDLATGLFVLSKTDLVEAGSLPIAITRTYRPNDTQNRAFGIGTNFSYGFFMWSAHQYTEVDLVLPDGGKVHFVRTSNGTGWTDAVFRSTATPGRYYGAIVSWNKNGWDVRLRDGTVYSFGENAPLQGIRDRYGNTITLTRTNGQTGVITRIASSSGRWVTLAYDGANRIASVTDQGGRTVGYTYNAEGYLWKVTDPNAGVTEYTYDASGRMRTLKDARGIVFLTNDYDANGRVQTQTQADSTTFGFAYTLDVSGKVTQTDVTDPRGSLRRVTFNAAGYTLTDTSAVGTTIAQTTTTTRQAGTNLPTSVIDALGRRTDYLFDPAGDPTSVTRLAGTGNAVATLSSFDQGYGELTSVTDPLNHATTLSYDSRGRLTKVTDARGKDTLFTVNANGQPLTTTDPMGKATSSAYLLGDLVSVTNAIGKKTSSFVDTFGRIGATTDALGASTLTTYDVEDRPVATTDALGATTQFAYDANGNVLTITDARGGMTVSTFDDMDRVLTREDPLHHLESSTYNSSGQPLTSTDGTGKVTASTYDQLGRPTFVGYGAVESGGSTTYESTIDTTFDAGNRIRALVDSAAGTSTYVYNDLDQLTSEVNLQGSTSYAYDVAGRRTRMTLVGQPDVTYTYDAANRQTSVTQGSDVVGFTYDDMNRRLTATLPSSITATYAYDDAGHLTSIGYKKGTTTIGDLTYTYNPDGRRSVAGGSLAGTTLPAALTAATYDAANQLNTWDGSTFGYDANGRLVTKSTTITPDTQAPTVPTAVAATAVGPRQINLTWAASSDNVGVTRYTVYRGGTALVSLAGSATTFTDWSAAPSTTYGYTVAASDAVGNASVQSSTSNATTPAVGTTYAADSFNRTVAGGWGTADTGGAWTGTDSTFSVSPGAGKVTLTTATNKNASLTSVSARDTDTLVKLNVNKLASGGDTVAWVALRRQSSTTYYSAQVAFKTSQAIALSFIRTSSSTNTTIGTGTSAATHAIADSYWLRVQISGTTATNGKLRIWKVGTTEPTTWTVNSTDNSTPTALRGNGHVGIRFQKTGTGNLPVVGTFSSLAITSIGGGAPPSDTTAPSVPAGLVATAVSSSQINLTWSASTDNVGVQAYRVYRNGVLQATAGSNAWSDTGLTGSTGYSYAVAAIDGAANASAQSTAANATTQGAGAATTYVWNARDELVQVLTGGTATSSYSYDVGRRVGKTVNGASTAYAADGPNTIQEQSGSTPTANLLTGSVDELFRRTDALGTRYPLTDALGSVLALVDSTGAVKTTYTYGPFGQTSSSGEANSNPTQYTGRENDGTGLYYYRARYYDPSVGRFITRDPAGFVGSGPNLYTYVADDPTNGVDPTGRIAPVAIACAAGAIGGFIGDLIGSALAHRKTSPLELIGAAAAGCVGGVALLAVAIFGPAVIAPVITSLGAVKDKIQSLYQSAPAQQILKGPIPDAQPQNLIQQLIMQAARANPGDLIIRNLGDAPRLQALYGPGEWVKMQYVEKGYVVHYFEDLVTGFRVQFKFVVIPPGG